MAEGGSVDSWTKRSDNEKGVHQENIARQGKGVSTAGMHARMASGKDTSPGSEAEDHLFLAKKGHKRALGELKSMPKPNLYADGGEVDQDDDDREEMRERMDPPIDNGFFAKGGDVHKDESQDKELIDDEMKDMMGEELMAAIDSKDKKRIMEGIEAIVMSCLSKE